MEFAASMAAAAAGGNKVICKVTTWEEFWISLDKYVFLASGGQKKVETPKDKKKDQTQDKDSNLESEVTEEERKEETKGDVQVVVQSTKQPLLVHIEEERNKVFSWIKKQEEEFKDKIENDDNLNELADFVQNFDEKLTCYQKFYKEHGSDLFVIFFRMYKMEHSSCVTDFSKKIVDCYKSEDFSDQESKLNTVLDNILLKITENADSQEMLVSLVQVMFDGKRHSMVVMKSIWIFSKIFTMVQKDQAKYMQGSLYAIGALLKVEARSYLSSTGRRSLIEEDCKKEEKNFEVKVRDLNQKEIELFEVEAHECLCNFVDSLLNIKDIRPGITIDTMKLHSSIIHEDFLEEYDEYSKKDHAGLMKCESANCGLLFLFDILQFFYQFLTETEQKPLSTDRYYYTDVSNYAKMYKTIPAYLNHKFKYTVQGSVKLVKHVLRAIKEICPNPSHLLELWHLRRHIEVLMNRSEDNEIKEEQNYERTVARIIFPPHPR